MNLLRTAPLVVFAAIAASAHAGAGESQPVQPAEPLVVNYAKPQAAAAAALLLGGPKFGVRVGGGQWNEFMIDAGVDVTFKVPFLPLPALRFDAEVWGTPSDFGGSRRGNALSLLAIQTFPLGAYAGLGPSYYFTDDDGDHKSGFGAKLLGGVSLPKGLYVEGGIIIGPSTPPTFVTVGMRF